MMTLERPATESLEHSYRLYADGLYAYLLSQCGDVHTAEDLLQQCFLKRAQTHSKVDDEKSYLFIAAKNLLINHQKSRQHKNHLTGSLLQLQPKGESSDLDASLLTAALTRLPEQDREIITLKFFSEMSFREMEQMLGVARSTLHDRYEQALAKLYHSYQSLGGIEP